MKSQQTKLLLLLGASATIGIVTDILVRQSIFGLNFLLWTSMWVGILSASQLRKGKLSYQMCIYAALALLNGVMVYVRAELVVQIWSVLSAITFIALMFGSTYIVNFFELPLLKRFLEYVVGSIMSIIRVIGGLAKSPKSETVAISTKPSFTVGMLIAVVLSLIFIGLFASSDQVFRQNFDWLGDALSSIGDWFNNFNIHVGRIVTIGFWIVVAFAWLAMAISRNRVSNTDEIKLTKFLSQKDAQVIIGAVCVIFALFVVVQLRFLFGGADLPEGISYADYARSGYGQLLLATVIASGVVYLTRNTTKAVGNPNRLLPALLLGLNAVVVLSAWKRLSLYESAYGWTMTRFVARMGLVCIMIGIIILAIWVAGKLSNRQVFTASWYTLALVLLASAAVNPIGLITERNIVDLPSREVALDVAHLLRQSPDSYASLCFNAPKLAQNYPRELKDLTEGFIGRSDGEYAVVFNPIDYPDQLNAGLSAHYTRSETFAHKYYDCLKK